MKKNKITNYFAMSGNGGGLNADGEALLASLRARGGRFAPYPLTANQQAHIDAQRQQTLERKRKREASEAALSTALAREAERAATVGQPDAPASDAPLSTASAREAERAAAVGQEEEEGWRQKHVLR